MTPVLSAVYDELLARAMQPPEADGFERWVQAFLRRTGRFDAGGVEAARRMDAAREDALCRGGWAARLAGGLSDPAEQSLAALLPRAHRGVFVFDRVREHRIVRDILQGGAFLLVPRDSVGREVIDDNEGAVCVARLVGGMDGCAMLPGVVFHRADATPHIVEVVATARERGMAVDDVCEALLRMDHALQTLSRVRPAYAYRSEALAWRDAEGVAGSAMAMTAWHGRGKRREQGREGPPGKP